MKSIRRVVTCCLLSFAVSSQAENPALPSSILPEGSKVELIKDGFKFTEGPALSPDGRIFFSDIPNNRIHVYDPKDQSVNIHREDTGGANGLMFDANGALIACEGSNRLVSRQAPQAGVETVAEAFDGKKLNSPNDLDIDAKGGIYFTDPRYGKNDDREIDVEAVYYVSPDGAVVTQVAKDFVKPNGIALSPDKKTLYVADNGSGKLHAYDVNAEDGSLSNGRVISEAAPVSDGICLDTKGNIYVTVKDEGVKVFAPDGKHIGTISTPEPPANCAFGAKGTKTLYITARTGFYKVVLGVDGLK